MSNQKNRNKKKESVEWNDRAKEIWLAGLGALSAVEEEGNKLISRLVDRGSEFEKKSKEQINEVWGDVSGQYKKLENQIGEKFDKAEESVESRLKSIVSNMKIPTRKEVNELSHKIDVLTEKVDKMAAKSSTSSKNKKPTKKSTK